MIEVPEANRILRYEVPVDDEWHTHTLKGPIVHVGSRDPLVVEFWAFDCGGWEADREFRVFGTGHPLPGRRLAHHGTVVVAGGQLVWHLIEGAPTSSASPDAASGSRAVAA